MRTILLTIVHLIIVLFYLIFIFMEPPLRYFCCFGMLFVHFYIVYQHVMHEEKNSEADLLGFDLRDFRHKYYELLGMVRWHRDQYLSGDNKCWKDNEKLYKVLPEGYEPPERDTLMELKNCEKYIESCHDPRIKYVSPQVRIEELEKEVEILKGSHNAIRDSA